MSFNSLLGEANDSLRADWFIITVQTICLLDVVCFKSTHGKRQLCVK